MLWVGIVSAAARRRAAGVAGRPSTSSRRTATRSTSGPVPGATTTIVVLSTMKPLPSTSDTDVGSGMIECAMATRAGGVVDEEAGTGAEAGRVVPLQAA